MAGGPDVAAVDPVLHPPLPPTHGGQHLHLILHLLDEALQGKPSSGIPIPPYAEECVRYINVCIPRRTGGGSQRRRFKERSIGILQVRLVLVSIDGPYVENCFSWIRTRYFL